MSDPRPAHFGKDPVLWFDVLVGKSGELVAVVANAAGRLMPVVLAEINADVRYVDDLAKYPASGRSGPGWIDLEDMVEVEVDDKAAATAAVVHALTSTVEPAGDFLVDSEGNKYDPETGRPVDE